MIETNKTLLAFTQHGDHLFFLSSSKHSCQHNMFQNLYSKMFNKVFNIQKQ